MSNSAQITLDTLHQVLLDASWLKEEEKNQIQWRINQIQRRREEPRVCIAFIGEKKAGKTALVRALTGVPLPVAVRECTAAICEIQVGLDWHHQAVYSSGGKEDFSPLDSTHQEDDLIEAKRNKKQTVSLTQKEYNRVRADFEGAQSAVIKKQEDRQEAQDTLYLAKSSHQEALGSNPWLWSLLSFFAWLIPPIRRRLERIEETTIEVERSQQKLAEIDQELVQYREEESRCDERLKESASQRQLQTEEADTLIQKAQKAYKDAIEANELKFKEEITELIDVNERPAERITIYTPNTNIPNNIVLLDTPGFNTDLEAHRRKAWEAIEELADICILVSDLRQPMPDTALSLLDRLEPFCPYMHVALTKTDLALSEAEDLGDDPMAEVREAEAVARSRIKRHWDRPMNIWTVASIAERDQRHTRLLFEDFWKTLPSDARDHKTHLLSIHAMRELMDILTVHIQNHKTALEKIDVAADLAYAMASQLEERLPEIESKTQLLITGVKLDTAEQIGKMEQAWSEQIENCETKRNLKKRWEQLQKQMPNEYKNLADALSKKVDQGARRIAGDIFQGDGELDVTESEVQSETENPEEEEENSSWLWTAGGIAAGATIGVMLSTGIALSLVFAVGAGGMARLLLAPLSKAKSNVLKTISESAQKEQKNIQNQLQSLEKEIAEKVLKAAEEELRVQIQKREKLEREKRKEALKEVQTMLTHIISRREELVREGYYT